MKRKAVAVDSPMRALAEQINELLAQRKARTGAGADVRVTGDDVARLLERVPGGGLLAPDGGLEPQHAARYRREAREEYHDEGTLEVDDGAVVSASDGGAYVQAWVWVSDAARPDGG